MLGSNRDREYSSLNDELKSKITLNFQDFTKITIKLRVFVLKGNGAGCGIRTHAAFRPQT